MEKNNGRKNNPDYEAKKIKTRDGVIQTVYYKKKGNKSPPKKNVGTPEKRRGGFKKPKASKGNIGMLNSQPSTTSSMAQSKSNYSAQRAQSNAAYQLETMNALSAKKREKLEGQYAAPKQQKMIKGRSRTNPGA